MSFTTRRRLRYNAVVVLTTLALIATGFSLATPASASVLIGEGGAGYNRHGDTKMAEKPCKEKMKSKNRNPKKCNGSGHWKVRTTKKKITNRQIAKYGHLKSARGVTLREAAAGKRPIWYATFAQGMEGASVFRYLWSVKNEGSGFYNGKDVWIEPKRGTGSGYHECTTLTERGYDITHTCSEHQQYYQEPGGGTHPYIQYYDYFDVAVVTKYVPFHAHYNIHINLHSTGTISYWYGDEKG